jgi:DNA-binding response OmpR family regulator
MRALVVEDDPDLIRQLSATLRDEGYAVDEATDGEEATYLGDVEPYDIVVLDLGLPVIDGVSVLKSWRAKGRTMPVLILTARGQWSEKVAGFDAGADDYLTKPFSPRELALRVRSVLRRTPTPPAAVPLEITVGQLTVSTAARAVTVAGQSVGLTNREFDLLLFFMTHTDTVFSREELLKRVWNWDFGDLSTVTVHVKRLRSKLGEHHRVQTVWGRGYLWRGEVGGGDLAAE